MNLQRSPYIIILHEMRDLIRVLSLGFALYGMECTAQTVSGQVDGYDYVDLGLKSGTMWATYNVGATKPTEKGDDFAWGETETKDKYEWETYKWCTIYENGNFDQFTKYVITPGYGTIDNKTVLEAEDDAAKANWGIKWRMPTTEEQKELIDGCTWVQERIAGTSIKVQKGTSKTNGAIIYLPYDEMALYYSSSLSEEVTDKVRCICIINSPKIMSTQRYYPSNVRAVAVETALETYNVSFYSKDSVLIDKQVVAVGKSTSEVKYPFEEGYEFIGWSDSSFTNVKKDLDVYAQYREIANPTTVNGSVNGYDYVNLGLPSGRLWATYNIGATKPTEFGDYFRWGQTKPCKNFDAPYVYDEQATGLAPTKDAATVNWGSAWRTPTSKEQNELIDGCDWEWTNNYFGSGVKGIIGISKINGNLIFLPAAGEKVDSDLFHANEIGHYWSSTPNPEYDQPMTSYEIGFSDWGIFPHEYDRYWGRPVRAVVSIDLTKYSNISNQKLQVYSRNGNIYITNAQPNTKTQVFDMNGIAIAASVTDGYGNAELSAAKGVYVVTVGNMSTKVILK